MPGDRNEIRGRRLSPYYTYVWKHQARRRQSEAMRDYLGAGIRAVATGARWLVSAAGSLLAAIDEVHAARRTYTRLSRLNDRELADIGLTRGQIYDMAWSPPRRAADGPAIVAAAADELVEQEYREAA